jgi:hypothetical protein
MGPLIQIKVGRPDCGNNTAHDEAIWRLAARRSSSLNIQRDSKT